MAADDVIYGLLLFLSIPFGLTLRTISNSVYREILCTASGLVLVVLVCRQHAIHALFLSTTNTVLILIFSKNRYLHIYSFILCFSYLAFFRTCHLFGIPKPSSHSNAVQLILTLKLVGVATEVVETRKLRDQSSCDPDNKAAALKYKYTQIDYSWPRLLSYSWCYIGALTGPFYTCRTYQDMLANQADNLPLWSDLKERLKPFPVCAVIFLLLSWTVSVQSAREEAFYEETSVLYRWFYLFFLFIWFRVRFYCAWVLAECIAVTAGLGAYPVISKPRSGGGPTDLQALEDIDVSSKENKTVYNFEAIRNILPYDCETSTSVRETIRKWNMCVQWWLVAHVYKNIPVQNKLARGVVLMAISSFWHGIHPGYYATLMSAPFLILAEDLMEKSVRSQLSNAKLIRLYDIISTIITMRCFEYYAVGVFFLQYNEIWRFWSSLYFYGHFATILCILGAQVLLKLIPKPKSDNHRK